MKRRCGRRWGQNWRAFARSYLTNERALNFPPKPVREFPPSRARDRLTARQVGCRVDDRVYVGHAGVKKPGPREEGPGS